MSLLARHSREGGNLYKRPPILHFIEAIFKEKLSSHFGNSKIFEKRVSILMRFPPSRE
jgi:hypothetical protein